MAWALPRLPGCRPATARERYDVRYLDAGIMNYVYRVETEGKTYFLKQALARVKRHDRVGADLAEVSPRRIRAESNALRVLRGALPPVWRAAVPSPAWLDAANNILWTEDAAPGGVALQEKLEQGRCEPAEAETAGRLLGAIHTAGSGAVPPLWGSPEADAANWDRFLRMRTTGVLPRSALSPEEEAAVRGLYREARRNERSGMVSHLDAAPKNVLTSPGGDVVLLDFELGAAISDPAYDPGFLAGHFVLQGENRPEMRRAARTAAAAVAAGYRRTGPRVDADWETRLARYAGLTLLYRLCGSSPAPYLDPGRYDAIRAAGVALLAGAATLGPGGPP